MLPKMKNLEDLSKIHLDVIKHSGFKWVMFRVSTEHQREGQRMRRREAELSVVRKPQDLWIITLKIETALSKLMEVPCKVVLLCTLFPKFALWNVFICNSNLGVWLWMTSSYFFKQSLFTWLYAWWPFGHRKTCWCALKSKWIPPTFLSTPSLLLLLEMCLFSKLKERSQKNWHVIVRRMHDTNGIATVLCTLLKHRCVCVQSHMPILCKHGTSCESTSTKSLQFIIYFLPPPPPENESFQY